MSEQSKTIGDPVLEALKKYVHIMRVPTRIVSGEADEKGEAAGTEASKENAGKAEEHPDVQ